MTQLKETAAAAKKIIKKDCAVMILAIMCAAVFLLFFKWLSMTILQSDDYFYASFWRDGFWNLVHLTKEHFINTNGRAIVHSCLQAALALPKFLFPCITTAIYVAICVLSIDFFKFFRLGKKDVFLYALLFFSLTLIIPPTVTSQTIMWASGFFNYIFPALFLFLTLRFMDKMNPLVYPFAFIAGATTEQWGAVSTAVLFAVGVGMIYDYVKNLPRTKKGAIRKGCVSVRSILTLILPPFISAVGFFSIFLSPGTQSRFVESQKMNFSLLDCFTKMSKLVFSDGRILLIMLIFIAVMASLSLLKGKNMFLMSGAVPFFLIFFSSEKCEIAFASFLCYMALCGVILYFYSSRKLGSIIFGALISILVMLPTNTYEHRIIFIMLFFLIIVSSCGAIMVINSFAALRLRKKIMYPLFSAVVLIIALALFIPDFLGYNKNYKLDCENLQAIKEAQETKSLDYNIDYDKKYVSRQMFNDGWFYSEFINLYNLSDCDVYMTSDVYDKVYYNKEFIHTVAPTENAIAYIPTRAVASAIGGSVTNENGKVIILLNGKELVMYDGMLIYSKDGKEQYEIADNHRLTTFYTLALDSSIYKNAFGIDVTMSDGRIDLSYSASDKK